MDEKKFVCACCGHTFPMEKMGGRVNVRSGGIMTERGNRFVCEKCSVGDFPERVALRTSKNNWNIAYTFGIVPKHNAEILGSLKYGLQKNGKVFHSTAGDTSTSGVKRMAESLVTDTGIKCWIWEIGFQFPIPQIAERFDLFGMEDVKVDVNSVSWVTHNSIPDEIVWQAEALKEFSRRFKKTGDAEKAFKWTVDRFKSYSSESQRLCRCGKYPHKELLWRK